jgi:hypothetical protein
MGGKKTMKPLEFGISLKMTRHRLEIELVQLWFLTSGLDALPKNVNLTRADSDAEFWRIVFVEHV